MILRPELTAIAVLVTCALAACSRAPESSEVTPAPSAVDTSVIDAARALLNEPASGGVDLSKPLDGNSLLPAAAISIRDAAASAELARASTAARRAADQQALAEMEKFETQRARTRGSQPLEVSLGDD